MWGTFMRPYPNVSDDHEDYNSIIFQALTNFNPRSFPMFIRSSGSNIKLLLAEEKFLKIKQVVTQPEYLQELLQNQEEKSIAELLAEERLQKANQTLNEKAEELREYEARARIRRIIIDDDTSDDDDYVTMFMLFDCVDIEEDGGGRD
ncbi:hypothetical protein Tco_0486614 [Tanacetum coccineum]